MIIPDMLKNAPMFKRLEARIKVCADFLLSVSHYLRYYVILLIFPLNIVQGKSTALGVGRGRAVAMRAKVTIPTQ